MTGRPRALRVVHPFPSVLNTGLVAALAYLASEDAIRAMTLAGGMLGMQFAIGATNDVVDRGRDALTKPFKPIPAGLVSVRAATAAALATAAAGLLLAAAGGPWAIAMWLVMLGCGLAYNFWLKSTSFAWACFSVAFALLPVYAWYGAVGTLPPRWEFLLLLSAAAGPALQLANGLVDLEVDRAAGMPTLVTRLGRRRTLIVVGALLLAIQVAAWSTIAAGARWSLALVVAGSVSAVAAFALSARSSVRSRAWGWTLQAVAVVLLGMGWVASVANRV